MRGHSLGSIGVEFAVGECGRDESDCNADTTTLSNEARSRGKFILGMLEAFAAPAVKVDNWCYTLSRDVEQRCLRRYCSLKR